MAASAPSSTLSDKALNGLGNVVKFLPTGTIFAYQYISPYLTNTGGETCSDYKKAVHGAFIALCGLVCFFSSFTDSYNDPSDGIRRYGIVTRAGLWIPGRAGPETRQGSALNPGSVGSPDLSSYRLRAGDFVHAFSGLIVFATLALLDANTVRCFYPGLVEKRKEIIQIVPGGIGLFTSVVFMFFPDKRHGIGYPASSDNTPPPPTTTTPATTANQNPNPSGHA